ncbi:isochorismatase family protein [Paenibacillus abyssi]|uniref:N-carbamoylsarcosine amidase n=1 Tax=Paenibacillus abyssi TaxID=1340531 RepID=A0A917CMP8_9BACL|nr:isochorismatase family protein [Paenibacillus abyssi]GGF93418.1 N-carbamoylsarcosine amidase [Paenibacillus abyssi]
MELFHNEWQFFKERGFGKTIGFGQRPAVLVIDLIRAFTEYNNPKMILSANLDSEIEQTTRILTAARANGYPVIFTTVAYEDKHFKDAGIWALKQGGVATLDAGSSGVEIDPRLDYTDEDSLLVKKYASAFFGTDLVSRLVSGQIDTVIMTGCTTSGCVRASAVDALSYGFRPIVVSDAVGDRSLTAHQQSLFDLQAKYADVVTTEETMSYLLDSINV